MKTKKKSLDKKETKVKANKSLVLRNDSKVKRQSIQSSERLCNRCKVHGITVSFKGHKCPNTDCLCIKCMDYNEKTRRRNENNKRRRVEKNAIKDKPKADTNSFVNSLKNKSKKILNNKKSGSASKKKKKNIKIQPISGSNDGMIPSMALNEEVNHRINMRGDSPPRLSRQRAPTATEPPIDTIDNNSSATDVDVNHSNPMCEQPAPEKSSAALCGQYLNACQGLSRKLSQYKLSEDELIASLKYFIVRQSLGDIDRAANDIICASQEIRLGASYNIQHPCDDLNPSLRQSASNSVRQSGSVTVGRSEPAFNNVVTPQILHSTMYPNYRPNDGHTYRPSFTPIHKN